MAPARALALVALATLLAVAATGCSSKTTHHVADKNAPRVNIVFVGDSITSGSYLDPRLMPQFQGDGASHSFAARLASELPTKYPEIPWGTFTNVAVNGTTSVQWASWVHGRVAPLHPDVVVLMLGINDAIANYEGGSESYTDFTRAYDSLVSQLTSLRNSRGRPTRLIVLTPPSATPSHAPSHNLTDARMAPYVASEWATARAHGIPVVDIWNAWRAKHSQDGPAFGSRYYTPADGIHPNSRGQALIFDMVAPVLRTVAAESAAGK
ncbi:MAG: SGNH/GDSL hydrolase family protein [Coriobacteriia bacterium]|nr:SGNH/GDSL hydrolase family protein [Coriobacteriia bacterium]